MIERRSVEAKVGRTIAIAKVLQVAFREIISRLSSSEQFNLRAIRKFDVLVKDAVRVPPSGLKRKAETTVLMCRLIKVGNRQDHMVDSDNGLLRFGANPS
jgi:hypothetical protein